MDLDYMLYNLTLSYDPGEMKVNFQIISKTSLGYSFSFEWVPNDLCHFSKESIHNV
jgi:hypothetical protein